MSIAIALVLLAPVSGSGQQARTSREPEDVTLHVDNHNWLDMHIYVSEAGGPLRSLGMVTSLNSQVFQIPMVGRGSGDVRIIADPIGGTGLYVSPTMIPNPRTEIDLTVQNALELSFTSIGPRHDESETAFLALHPRPEQPPRQARRPVSVCEASGILSPAAGIPGT